MHHGTVRGLELGVHARDAYTGVAHSPQVTRNRLLPDEGLLHPERGTVGEAPLNLVMEHLTHVTRVESLQHPRQSMHGGKTLEITGREQVGEY